ncbi:tRNA (adenosine(37)-N6)-dimethylallyltransferase MiaA [Cecembia sp.]|uniref:tRNA (adenosine(37)-N6)-dimethylallyltransferase MiaA n=1 Tax=Cecembia sp. TaxID=1898110 RepID=UPI0025BB727A|nr:tRNA (adenosine(37)-N6)-dimethylallyltransferase MiaA [Cecembia sp.]
MLGPTAVGKTALCLKLAKKFETEIISADSRQFYRETEIGTAKPSFAELQEVKHHFVGHKSIWDNYDVKTFENDTLSLLESIFKKKDLVILTGGSGLFIDVVCSGLDEIPDVDPLIRKELIESFEKNGIESLQKELESFDPEYFKIVDLNNPQRLMRALEVCRGTGKAYSSFRKKTKKERPFEIIKIGLYREREELYKMIDLRMDIMIEQGLFAEASQLFEYHHLNALHTVGYTEIFGYLKGEYNKEEAVRLLKRNSRRYAKRQMTWFRKDPEVSWFQPNQENEIIKHVSQRIKPIE